MTLSNVWDTFSWCQIWPFIYKIVTGHFWRWASRGQT